MKKKGLTSYTEAINVYERESRTMNSSISEKLVKCCNGLVLNKNVDNTLERLNKQGKLLVVI